MKPVVLQQQIILDNNTVFVILKSHFEKFGYDIANMQIDTDNRSVTLHVCNKNIEIK